MISQGGGGEGIVLVLPPLIYVVGEKLKQVLVYEQTETGNSALTWAL